MPVRLDNHEPVTRPMQVHRRYERSIRFASVDVRQGVDACTCRSAMPEGSPGRVTASGTRFSRFPWRLRHRGFCRSPVALVCTPCLYIRYLNHPPGFSTDRTPIIRIDSTKASVPAPSDPKKISLSLLRAYSTANRQTVSSYICLALSGQLRGN